MLANKIMFRVFFILWCLSWPVSVLTALQEPFGAPQSQVAMTARAIAAANMLAFYVCGVGWLIHRTRRALGSGSAVSSVIAAWAMFAFLNPLGPVVLVFSWRMLRGANAAT